MTRAILSLSLLACGCSVPTAPSGWYRANGAGFWCAVEPVVLPIADGSGECVWCGDVAVVCGPAVELEPWLEGGR